MPSSVFDIREFGAVGDGSRSDTPAVQKAIDACHERGGGRVNVPPGVFCIGSIVLKSFVELHLEAGATLSASTNRREYPQHLQPAGPQPQIDPADRGSNHYFAFSSIFRHFIHANDSEGVSITGRGTIDGNGRLFFTEHPVGGPLKQVRDWRPGHMIGLVRCRDVLIRDVRLIDSTMFTIWPRTCERVRIEGVRIINDPLGQNTDGIDLDGCRDVVINNCIIDVGDDAIAVKSGSDWMNPNQPADGLVVSNCVLSSKTCGVRLGYEGDGPIRNCAFSNIVMQRTRTGINMLVPHNREHGILHGPGIENISFSNIVMDTVLPIYLWIDAKAATPGCIRNINISNLQATAERACYIGGGGANLPVESVRLRNVRLNMRGQMNGDRIAEPVPSPYPAFDYWPNSGTTWPRSGAVFKGLPHALFARHVRDLDIQDFRVDWSAASGHWHSAIRVESGSDVRLEDIRAEGVPGDPGRPVIDWKQNS
jgi:polygalacturonase